MREIKFRGRRTFDKKWIYGNLVIDEQGNKHSVPSDMFYEDGHHLKYDDESDLPVFFDEETIGQYALHDVDSKDVYVGDLVESVYWNEFFQDGNGSIEEFKRQFEVVFHNAAFCLREIGSSCFFPIDKGKLKVIGNIYDNPELISDKEGK